MTGRIFRIVFAVATAAALTTASAVPVVAAPAHPEIAAMPATVVPGARIDVAGEGFDPYEGVDLFVDGVHRDVVTTDVAGTFDGRLTMPDGAVPGRHWISARGRRHGVVVQTRVDMRVARLVGWPQPAYDAARTGAAPADQWITISRLPGLMVASRRLPSDRPPIVVGDTMIGVTGGYYEGYEVVASDVWTGEIAWRSDMSAEFGATPTSDGDIVAVNEYRTVRAIDLETGATRWTRAMPAWIDQIASSPAIADGRVIVAAHSWAGRTKTSFVALDAGTGTVLWRTTLPGSVGWSQSSVAVADDAIYSGLSARRGGIVSIDADTGKVRWRLALREDEMPGPISVADGVVYAHTEWTGDLIAIDADTGRARWRVERIGGSGGYDSLAIVDGTVIVGSGWWESSEGELAAVDALDGTILWRRSMDPSPSGASAAGPIVFVTVHDGTMLAVEAATGETSWRTLVTGDPSGRPVIADGAIYVASWNGTVTTLREPGPAKPAHAALLPDPTVRLDGEHELEAVTDGWTVLGDRGLGAARNADVTSAVAFRGDAYVGTRAAPGSTGAEVWQSSDGGTLERAAAFGGARSAEVAVFGGALYVLTVGEGGIDLYRSSDGVDYGLVAGAPTEGSDATTVVLDEQLVMMVRTEDGVSAFAIDTGGDVTRMSVPQAQPRGLRPLADRLAPWADGVDHHGARYIGLASPAGGTIWRTAGAATFEQVPGIDAFVGKDSTPVPQVTRFGRLFVVVEGPDGLRVISSDEGSTFEQIPIEVDPLPDRDVGGDLAVTDAGLVLATRNRDQRVLEADEPLEVARARAFSVHVSTDGSAFAEVRGLPTEAHDARSSLVAADGTMLLAVSNFREGDGVWRSVDGTSWEPIFREDGTTPFTTDARVAVVDGYAYLFLTDRALGVTTWRFDTPVAAIAEGATPVWTLLAVGALIAIAALGAGWLFLRRRRRPSPPGLGPTEPWGPAVPSHERLQV